MEQDKVEAILKSYEEKYTIYEEFANSLKRLLADILTSEELKYLSIEARAKDPASLRAKLTPSPVNIEHLAEINDLTGARVITFVYEDIKLIEDFLSSCLKLEPLTGDERLGVDRVGYRSHHWLVSYSADRLDLPEYKKFNGLKAELQIRTVLQHAWAQIGHNQVYKPNVILPEKLKRDFTLLAGHLEIADNEFSRISEAISNYGEEVEKKTSSGDLDVPIDSISLRSFFDKKFDFLSKNEKKFGPQDDMTERIIEELKLVDISTLKGLDAVIPKDFIDKLMKFERATNFTGIARNIMVIADADKYFSSAWRHSWTVNEDDETRLWGEYGIDVLSFIHKYSK